MASTSQDPPPTTTGPPWPSASAMRAMHRANRGKIKHQPQRPPRPGAVEAVRSLAAYLLAWEPPVGSPISERAAPISPFPAASRHVKRLSAAPQGTALMLPFGPTHWPMP